MFLVRNGQLVARTGPRSYRPLLSGSEDPIKTMKAALPPTELVYVWDVDGVEAGAANHDFYQRLERQRVAPWIDPGCRNPEDAMDAFFAGAEVLTVRVEHMSEEKLVDFADIAENEFHVAVPFPGTHPDAPITAWDLRRLVGELHAQGVVLEAAPGTDKDALVKFVKLVQAGGIEVTLLSTESVPWLRGVASENAVARLIEPWRPAR